MIESFFDFEKDTNLAGLRICELSHVVVIYLENSDLIVLLPTVIVEY